jgi:response regulator RpfG family c-di-GMP phosphodiesterase
LLVRRLRFKILLLFLPLLLLAVIVSDSLGFLEYQSALIRALNRHLSYKAEQLRDFMYSEWGIVEDLKLANQDEYRHALERSFRSYAYSLLRDDTEQVLALDAHGQVLSVIGLKGVNVPSPSDAASNIAGAGWFSTTLAGQEIVGVSFAFAPFQWTVAITQPRAVFFAGLETILFTNFWILLGSLAAGTLLTVLYVGRVVKPIERLSSTVEGITLGDDLSKRVEVESADEVGLLSHRFNLMIANLEKQMQELMVSEQAEREAKETAAQRERETLFLLGKVSDLRDQETGQHLTRIGAMSGLLAELAGLDEKTQTLIRLGSPLHDLGKISIPDAILLKPGALTPDEMEVMRKHTIYGYEILKTSQSHYLIEGATIALSHHEKWDGTGYPQGLAGQDIPLSARIVAIVDVFDALLSERPYKRPWTHQEALDFLAGQSGKHFDPELAVIFLNNAEAFIQARGDAPKVSSSE